MVLQFNSKFKLLPHQQNGVRWMNRRRFGCLAFDMGLGKTPTILRYLVGIIKNKYTNDNGRFIILAPKSLISQIKDEVEKFIVQDTTNTKQSRLVNIYHGNNRYLDPNATFTVSTYQTFTNDWNNRRINFKFDSLVVDEVHNFRNSNTIKYQYLQDFICNGMTDTATCFGLSGTPFVNKIKDLYNIVALLSPVDTDFILNEDDIMQHFHIVQKDDIIHDLPPVQFHRHAITLTKNEQKVTNAITQQLHGYLQDIFNSPNLDISHLLTQINLLIKATSYYPKKFSPHYGLTTKVKYLLIIMGLISHSKIKQLIPDDRQIVVFTKFKNTLSAVQYFLLKYGIDVDVYHGGLNQSDRLSAIHNFKTGKSRVLVCTIQSASVGLNLQNANHVLILDQWWNDAIQKQAIDRCHRIGQTKPVHVYEVYAKNTIDDQWLLKLRLSKSYIYHDILKHGIQVARETAGLSKDDLRQLLHYTVGTKL